jgi:hypothetical protein
VKDIHQTELKNTAMTLAQQFRQEGEITIAQRLLTRKFPALTEQL